MKVCQDPVVDREAVAVPAEAGALVEVPAEAADMEAGREDPADGEALADRRRTDPRAEAIGVAGAGALATTVEAVAWAGCSVSCSCRSL